MSVHAPRFENEWEETYKKYKKLDVDFEGVQKLKSITKIIHNWAVYEGTIKSRNCSTAATNTIACIIPFSLAPIYLSCA